MNIPQAIAVLESSSIATGTQAADAMVKRAPITTLRIGTVQPGKYIIIVGGMVAAVEEAYREGLRLTGHALIDEIFLPEVHPQVYESVEGVRRKNDGDALGVIETASIPANIHAADRAIKSARVNIVEIRLGDGLGGKGVTMVTGKVEDVEAAVEAGTAAIQPRRIAVSSVVIPAQHSDLRERVEERGAFFK